MEVQELDNEYNVICPIKLLIIVALRTGAVTETTYGELISNIRARQSKVLVWAYPERPVLPAFGPCAAFVDVGAPAPGAQILSSLKLAGDLVGMLSAPWTHDIRRGSARDIAYAPSFSILCRSMMTDVVARALGHSDSTRRQGITDAYIGHVREDLWGVRVRALTEADPGPGNFSTPELAVHAYKKQRRLSPLVVSKACKELGLDYGTPQGRRAAKSQLHNQARKSWKVQERSCLDAVAAREDEDAEKEDQAQPNVLHDEDKGEDLDGGEHNNRHRDRALAELTPSALNIQAQEGAPVSSTHTDHANIDPALLVLDEYLFCQSTSLLDSAEGQQAVLDVLYAEGTTSSTDLTSDTMTFVSHFAQVNVVLINSAGRKMADGGMGGSKDIPKAFEHRCPNAIYGCTGVWTRYHLMETHFTSCKMTSPEAAAKLKAAQRFKCTEEGCDWAGSSKEVWRNHIKFKHKGGEQWTPKACGAQGCTDTQLFATRNAWNTHRLNIHRFPHWTPRLCTMTPCHGTHTYATPTTWSQHLRRVHKLNAEKQRPYL